MATGKKMNTRTDERNRIPTWTIRSPTSSSSVDSTVSGTPKMRPALKKPLRSSRPVP
jgi:hypothetical protein